MYRSRVERPPTAAAEYSDAGVGWSTLQLPTITLFAADVGLLKITKGQVTT